MKYLFLPVALLALWIFASFAFRYTIAPVDHYGVHPYVYQPGNALKIRNNYVTDIMEIHLPWKFYISAHPERACVTKQFGRSRKFEMQGIVLPDGFCYPLEGSRHYMLSDIFFPLVKVFDFFRAYDLSYFVFLVSLLFAGYFFFREFLRLTLPGSAELDFYSCLAAILFSFSFPVARELQYDGINQGFPFLLIGGALLQSAERENQRGWRLSGASLAMGFAFWKGSLQCLGIYSLFLGGFFLIWNLVFRPGHGGRRTVALAALLPGFLAGLWFNRGAIEIFLSDPVGFLPNRNPSWLAQELRRLAGWGTSAVHFFGGDLIFSFDTLDLSKAIGQVGSREIFSYDGNSFFLSPLVAVFFASFLLAAVWGRWRARDPDTRKVLVATLFFLAIDLALVVLPTYRLLYYRFHQWWLAANLSLLFTILVANGTARKIPARAYLASLGLALIVCAVSFVVVYAKRDFLLAKLGTGGRMGFEPDFWQHRITFWLERISLRDFYALAFAGVAVIGAWALRCGRRGALLVLVTVSTLGLNIFHYNQPQPEGVFYHFLEVFKARLETDEAPEIGRPAETKPPYPQGRPGIAQNVMLLADKPTGSIYDSLSVPLNGEPEQKPLDK